MIQGDVYYYKFKFPNKERPILILTGTDLISSLNAVTVAEVTTTLRETNSEVWLDEEDGMFEKCAVNLINVQTVAKTKLGSYITHLSEERMAEVFEAIKFTFGFDE